MTSLLAACSGDPATQSPADAAAPTDTGTTVVDRPATPTDTPATPTDTPVGVDRPATPMDVQTPPADVPAPRDVPAVPVDVPTENRRLSIGPITLTPGNDITRCTEVRLGNAAEALVRHIHVSLTHGSHHLIVYRSTATTEQRTPFSCRPLEPIITGTAPIFIAQMPESDLVMPAGVGLTIAANQMIRIEEHFYTTDAASAMGTISFDLSAPTGLTRADMLFWGTTEINVPARSMGTSRFFHTVRAGSHLFGLTSHTHRLGVLSMIDLVPSMSAPPGEELHRSTSWEEPPLTRFDPPIDFDGSMGLRLVCNYNNITNSTVRFGEDFNDEMCFLWGYYYPSHGFDVCFNGTCIATP